MGTQTEIKKEQKEEAVRKMTGAQALIEIFLEENVETVFGYPGGAIMPVYDAIYDYRDRINHILTRHEQGSVHAAQGYARTSGKIGMVLSTSGPGATNLITGIADAMIDSTPLICITGQVFAPLLGTDAFQETDVINATAPLTKWNYQITKPEEIPSVMAKAFYIAKSGRPGPVVIDFTKDAQVQEFDFGPYEKCTSIRSYKPIPKIKESKIKEAAEMINSAKKPLVLFGQGVILGHAEEEFKAFIEKANLPAAWTILGLSALDSDHPLNVGMLGMHGNYAPNVNTNECDVLIAVGMRFDDRVTGRLDKYAKQAKVVHFDIDFSEIHKNVHADVAVIGDCKQTLPMVTELLDKTDHSGWINNFKELEKKEIELCIDKELNPTTDVLSMGEVIKHVNEITKGDAVIVSDVGQHQMVACRYSKFVKSKSNVTSAGLGTMGFGLPAAIGAKLGAPDRQVILVVGDGGFQMTLQELGTIMQNDIDVKILLLNNEFLGMVRQWQDLFMNKRYSFTEIEGPDFIKLSESYRIEAEQVSERKDLKAAVERMLTSEKAYLLEVKVGKENNVFPMVPQGSAVSEIRLS